MYEKYSLHALISCKLLQVCL